MFALTIAHDAMRVIILLISSFFWLSSFVVSAAIWFALVPLRDTVLFGIIMSVLAQEGFRFLLFVAMRKADRGLREVGADDIQVIASGEGNKHMLAYVSGLGFGLISGVFTMANLLADAYGPATVGLGAGSEMFFVATAAQTLAMIIMHVVWSIIFFNGYEKQKIEHIVFVVVAHLFVSCMTLWNGTVNPRYDLTLSLCYCMAVVSSIVAFRILGGTSKTLKIFLRCQ